mmetsp:Transcript_60236/g.111683  ORF Transcript_60236/g.111683 Transcript_60236/m.111683 type:complete len:128 (+) Transcript_60236:67-450(+)
MHQTVAELLKNPFRNFTFCTGYAQEERPEKAKVEPAKIVIDDEEITRMLDRVDNKSSVRVQEEVKRSLAAVDECLLFVLPPYEQAVRAKQTEDSTSVANAASAILAKLERSRGAVDTGGTRGHSSAL